MNEKPEALLRRQHADNISVAHMKIRIERLEAENERLREALEMIAGYRPCVIDGFKRGGLPGAVIANAALRREET